MKAPTFPVGIEVMQADLEFEDLEPGQGTRIGEALVRSATVDHPNGCVAYRLDHKGMSVVYATDLEHHGEPDPGLVALARGADLLIYDAMYTPEEYEGRKGPSRKGWGHSTYEAGATLAEAAEVDELCLFHHDPTHDDAFMDALGARARLRYSQTSVAKEGMVFLL
jgi:ribonuclease BN (tRNA processing enzyme)